MISVLKILFFVFPLLLSSQCFAAPLDYDGDGLSNAGTYSVSSKNERIQKVYFRWIDPHQEELLSASVPGQYPVVGEYLGNGKTQLATLRLRNSAVFWNVRGSGRAPRQFGRIGDTFVSGCRFASPSRASFAYLRGRTLSFTELASRAVHRVAFRIRSSAELVGCGDINNDGIDEALFRTPGRDDAPDLISGFSVNGRQQLSMHSKKFIRFFSVKRPDGVFDPLLAVSREYSPTERVVSIEPLFRTSTFTSLLTSMRLDITNGFFLSSQNIITSGLLFKESSSDEVFNRILDERESDTFVYATRPAEKLVKAVSIFKVKGLHD